MSKQTDISQQIKKYLNGELDARAMHRLERQAQSDPFLRDALEGYELPGADHDKNLDELASWLQKRIEQRERRIIPFRFIATAAALLLFLLAGLLWHLKQPAEQEKQIVKIKTTPEIKKEKIDTLLITQKKTEIAKLTKKRPPQAIITPDDAVQENNMAQNTSSSTDKDISIDAPVGNSDAKVTYAAPNIPLDSLNLRKTANAYSKIAGVSVNNIIKGVVKDELNHPIPGATVSVRGTNKTTVTDVNGKFVLPDVSNSSTLNVAYVGYSQQQIAVNNKRDSIVIAMQPNNNSLSEVVVVGYGTNKKQDDDQGDNQYQSARPQNGWSAYRKYLKENAIAPDGKSGVIKLEFTVNSNGRLSDFKIIKGLNDVTNNTAIRLINTGPRWLTNTDRKPEVVKVRIKFITKK